MKEARYIDPASGAWRVISADRYNPDVHGTDLRCYEKTHLDCAASMRFVAATVAEGGLERPALFASVERQGHSPDCLVPLLSQGSPHNSVNTLQEALDKKLPIILNLNFDMAHPDYLTQNWRAAQRADTPYNRLRRENLHFSFSIRSLKEYFSKIEMLRNRDPSMEPNFLAAHAQNWRRVNTFELNTEEKLRKHFEAMASDIRPDETSGIVTGFPRALIGFTPTHSQIESGSKGLTVRGSPFFIREAGKHAIRGINVLHFGTKALLEEFMAHTHHDVGATPRLSIPQWRAALGGMHRRKDTYVSIDWNIEYRHQFIVAQEAIPTPTQLEMSDI